MKREGAPLSGGNSHGFAPDGDRDERKKLDGLRASILSRGAEERERILKEAEACAERWLADHTAQLDATVRSIRDDAVKQAQDISDRRLVEAGTSRDRERLRLRSGLVQEALASLQKALVGLSARDDYDAILTGVAAEVCERLRSGRVGLRLRAEDAPLGEGIARALRARFPKLDVRFDDTPEPILGGVVLLSEDEGWRISADWRAKIEEMTDSVAEAVLAEL